MKPLYIFCKPEQKAKVDEVAQKLSKSLDTPITVITNMKELPKDISEIIGVDQDENGDTRKTVVPTKGLDAEALATIITNIQEHIEVPEIKLPEPPEIEYCVDTIRLRKERQEKFNRDQQAKARRYLNKHYRK